MTLGQPQYFYTVELKALEQNLSLSLDRVSRLHEKALKREDFKAVAQANQFRVMNFAQHRIARLK